MRALLAGNAPKDRAEQALKGTRIDDPSDPRLLDYVGRSAASRVAR